MLFSVDVDIHAFVGGGADQSDGQVPAATIIDWFGLML